MRLPSSVQEIANVIGVDKALYLVGKLPRCYAGVPGKQSNRPILYVPKTLVPDSKLVSIIGWEDAAKLVHIFGGELLMPANCMELYQNFRIKTVLRMLREGGTPKQIAELLGISSGYVMQLKRTIPQVESSSFSEKNHGQQSKKNK